MSGGTVVKVAMHTMGGTVGEMAMALERQKPLNPADVLKWVKRLRAAADVLEALVK